MPTLYPLLATRTPADGNVEAPHKGATDNLLLILLLHPLEGQWAAASWALLRSRYGNLLVDMIRNRSVVLLAVLCSWLAPWGFRILLPLSPRVGRRLAAGRTLRRFQFFPQFVNFLAQPLGLLLQARFLALGLVALPPGLVALAPGLVALLAHTPEFLRQLPKPTNRADGLGKQISL